MTLISVSLIILSAIIHAGWNLALKKENDHSLFFVVMFSFISALCSIPIFIIFHKSLQTIPTTVFFIAIASGFFMAIYTYTLNISYHYGEISLAYPLVRSLPIIFVAVITTALSIGKPLSIASIIGMIIIMIGCFILPTTSIKDLKLKNYINLTTLFAVIAALGTTGYSIFDDLSISSLNKAVIPSVLNATFVYAAVEFICTFSWLFLLTILFKRNEFKQIFYVKHKIRSAAIVGIGSFLGYFIILIAMSFVTNVSYVVAFRQLSIPLGAILGMIIFKETKTAFKIGGIIILFIGLVIVAVS